MTFSEIARFLGVSPNQVYMWYKRRSKNGFPEPWAYTIAAPRGGPKRAPMFNITEVVEWYIGYEPYARHGKHWGEKRKARASQTEGFNGQSDLGEDRM